jgi:hypothetical protein
LSERYVYMFLQYYLLSLVSCRSSWFTVCVAKFAGEAKRASNKKSDNYANSSSAGSQTPVCGLIASPESLKVAVHHAPHPNCFYIAFIYCMC